MSTVASKVAAELKRIEAQLAKPRLAMKDRLPLLRRQAALGDLRDAEIERARRFGPRS